MSGQLQSSGQTGIVLAGSTSCTPAQCQYSVYKFKFVGIIFAVEKSKYYIEGVQMAKKVYTDHCPLASLASLDLSSSPNNSGDVGGASLVV